MERALRGQHDTPVRGAALRRLEDALTQAERGRRAERERALRGRHDALVRGAPVREYRLDGEGRLVARA